jgi:serine phosphatase RsbU (regulator of sigma subunit)
MGVIVILRGPDVGKHFPLLDDRSTVGRNSDCTVSLPGKQISRLHAHLYFQEGNYLVEDMGSSNGTFVNGNRLTPHTPTVITERDTFQIGPYLFGLRTAPPHRPQEETESSLVVRETISATSLHEKLLTQDPAAKLHMVLEIAQQLSSTLELDALLDKLLEQLLKLLPQADRIMVILCEGEKLIVRAQRTRREKLGELSFSRTIVRRALDEGIGIISEDVQSDQRYEASHSITSLDLHSVICVPLINQEGRRFGVIQVDRFCQGYGFRVEDLHMLTAIGMIVTVVLENVSLHAEKLREERLIQELAMARDIQEGYLPDELEGFPHADFEIFGRVFPAREVAGDFYDFVKTPTGRLAFFIGDVSGKGMPAALYMIAVRTLCRHVVKETDNPEQLLAKLNVELADNNPSCMFVTLAHGLYEPTTGHLMLASAGHPPPFLRHVDGSVEPVALKPGRLLGYSPELLQFPSVHLLLEPGETLCFFTDGILEARAPVDRTMFGMERIRGMVEEIAPSMSLADGANKAKLTIDRYTGKKELQDDLTLLLLRRNMM